MINFIKHLGVNGLRPYLWQVKIFTVCCPLSFIFCSIFSSSVLAIDSKALNSYQASDYFANPMLPETQGQKIILVHVDQSTDMLERAYASSTFALSTFDASSNQGMTGYFNAKKQYRYNSQAHYFEEDNALVRGQSEAWDGQFLNWLMMRKLDLLRWLLLGSSIQNSSGNIELIKDTAIKATTLRDPQSQHYSPIPNFMPISLKHDKLEFQNKTVFLRLKASQSDSVKGLLELIGPSIDLYFYSHTSFGDQKKLIQLLRNWQISDRSQNKVDYHAAQLNGLRKVLDSSKVESSKLANLNNGRVLPCQRYVHINMSHTDYGVLPLNDAFLKDCQPAMSGKQTLKAVEWGSSNKLKARQTSTTNRLVFAYSEKDQLFRALFKHLFLEEQNRSYQLTGADMAQFSDGAAILYQSLSQYAYNYKDIKDNKSIKWTGDLRASLIDEQGRLRSDNGDKTLGSLSEDPLVSSCFDEVDQQLRFRLSQQNLPASKCNILNYPYLDKDIGYLWQAAKKLSEISEQDRLIQRSPFQRSDHKRYMRTHIGQTEYDFVAGQAYPLQGNSLQLASEQALKDFINYVRGEDQEGKRSRRKDAMSFLLADSFQSSPVVVAQPVSNYHLLYGDASYQAFLKQYQNRRSRVFLASQGGMLHSFNAGWYDSKNKQLTTTKVNLPKWGLGQELWAFVPYAVLPFLQAQQDIHYGISPEHHFNLFPQKPYIFDAKVFDKNAVKAQPDRVFLDAGGKQLSRETHPAGWGTLMVVATGLGKVSLGDFKPTYLVFDITDAEQSPTLLASIKAPNMGSALSLPSVITQTNKQGDMDWYLALGSGSDLEPETTQTLQTQQSAGVYLYDLKKLVSSHAAFKPKHIDLHTANAYVAGITAVDWDLNGETDAVYANTVSHKTNTVQSNGSLHRVTANTNHSTALAFKSETLFSTNSPFHARPQVSLDSLGNRWLFMLTSESTKSNYPVAINHKIIGLKEPRDPSGRFLVDFATGKSSAIAENDLLNVSDILVNSDNGQLSGTWQLQPKLVEPTVSALEKRLMAFSEPQKYLPGWLRHLDKGEVPHGANTLFGGTLTQATFQPSYLNCQLSADAFIHRLRFTTGTAWFDARSNKSTAMNTSATLTNTKGQSVDSSAVNAILLHNESGVLRQLQSFKQGKTQTTVESTIQVPISAETSWREL